MGPLPPLPAIKAAFAHRRKGSQGSLDLSQSMASLERRLMEQTDLIDEMKKVLPLTVAAPGGIEARALAREIVDNAAPVSVALTRQLMWRMAGAEHPMIAHRADSRAIQARGASADSKEGVNSFLEKRAPAFPNRVSEDLPDVWPAWQAPPFA